jgi:hypothetical protein
MKCPSSAGKKCSEAANVFRLVNSAVRGSELYGGSGFRRKTLRWEIATAGCRSREIDNMCRKRMRELFASRSRAAGDSVLVKTERERNHAAISEWSEWDERHGR